MRSSEKQSLICPPLCSRSAILSLYGMFFDYSRGCSGALWWFAPLCFKREAENREIERLKERLRMNWYVDVLLLAALNKHEYFSSNKVQARYFSQEMKGTWQWNQGWHRCSCILFQRRVLTSSSGKSAVCVAVTLVSSSHSHSCAFLFEPWLLF